VLPLIAEDFVDSVQLQPLAQHFTTLISRSEQLSFAQLLDVLEGAATIGTAFRSSELRAMTVKLEAHFAECSVSIDECRRLLLVAGESLCHACCHAMCAMQGFFMFAVLQHEGRCWACYAFGCLRVLSTQRPLGTRGCHAPTRCRCAGTLQLRLSTTVLLHCMAATQESLALCTASQLVCLLACARLCDFAPNCEPEQRAKDWLLACLKPLSTAQALRSFSAETAVMLLHSTTSPVLKGLPGVKPFARKVLQSALNEKLLVRLHLSSSALVQLGWSIAKLGLEPSPVWKEAYTTLVRVRYIGVFVIALPYAQWEEAGSMQCKYLAFNAHVCGVLSPHMQVGAVTASGTLSAVACAQVAVAQLVLDPARGTAHASP
jgi:hypothetical protein